MRCVQVGAGAVAAVVRVSVRVRSQPTTRVAVPRVTTDTAARVVVVWWCWPARAGGRVTLCVARVPTLVGSRFALAHEAVNLCVVRSVRRRAGGLATVVRVLAVYLLKRSRMVVRSTKVRVQSASVVVVTARSVRVGRVVGV